MNNSNGSGKFINGFFWGALIGAGVIFLLGTKKGKQILKVISEEGLELSQLFSEGGCDDSDCECEDECDECAKEPVHVKHSQNNQKEPQSEKVHEGIVQETGEEKVATNGHSSPRRFFRGIKRK